MLAVPQPARASAAAHSGSAASFPRAGRGMSGAQHTEQSSGSMPTRRHLTTAARPRRRGRPRRALALAVAAAVAVPVAGCADDSPPTRPREGRVEITLDDFSIAPQRIRARPGRLVLEVANAGAIGHTLRVM